ncbi:MAG: twin-arginine translocation signal domain-containing protein, partial [Planctomycetota bacterium]
MAHSYPCSKAGLSRRRFLEKLGLGCAAGSVGGLSITSIGWGQENSGPIDCG